MANVFLDINCQFLGHVQYITKTPKNNISKNLKDCFQTLGVLGTDGRFHNRLYFEVFPNMHIFNFMLAERVLQL